LTHQALAELWQGGQMIFPVLSGIGFILAGSTRTNRALFGCALIVLSYVTWVGATRIADGYRTINEVR
jgi:hypothetical protein